MTSSLRHYWKKNFFFDFSIFFLHRSLEDPKRNKKHIYTYTLSSIDQKLWPIQGLISFSSDWKKNLQFSSVFENIVKGAKYFFEKIILLAAYDQILAKYIRKLGTYYSFALGRRLKVPLWGSFCSF